MCGLFGCYSTDGDKGKLVDLFKALAFLSEERGKHSAGFAAVTKPTVKKRPSWLVRYEKDTVTASSLMRSSRAKRLLDDDPILLMGHTRFATHGSVSWPNAHPFELGHIVGAHNGVYPELFKRNDDVTDSRVIFQQLNKLGAPQGLRYINEKFTGDMALTFINKSNGTFNLFTNGGRSLYLGKTGHIWMWASDERFLKKVATNWQYLQPVPVDTLVSLRLGTERWRATEYEYDRSKPYSKQVCLPQRSYESGGHIDTPVGGAGGVVGGVGTASGGVVLGPQSSALTARYRTMPGVFMTREAINQLLAVRGCTLCLDKAVSSMTSRLYFFEPQRFFCEACRSNDALVGQFYDESELHEGTWVLSNGKEVRPKGRVQMIVQRVNDQSEAPVTN